METPLAGMIDRAAATNALSPQEFAAFTNLAVIALIAQSANEALADDLAQHSVRRTGEDARIHSQLSAAAARQYQNRMGPIIAHQMRSVAVTVR